VQKPDSIVITKNRNGKEVYICVDGIKKEAVMEITAENKTNC